MLTSIDLAITAKGGLRDLCVNGVVFAGDPGNSLFQHSQVGISGFVG